jgi:hypothetical protein
MKPYENANSDLAVFDNDKGASQFPMHNDMDEEDVDKEDGDGYDDDDDDDGIRNAEPVSIRSQKVCLLKTR